jgi:hypothetical protein
MERFGGASRDRTDDLIVANDGVRQKSLQFGVHLAAVYGPKRSNSDRLAGVASNFTARVLSVIACGC